MKKSLQIPSAISVLMLFISGCGPVTPVPTPTVAPPPTLAPSPTSLSEAQRYLWEAIDIIQKNALRSKNVDWAQVRATALTFEKFAKTPADTYDTISYVLRQLGDHHSFFMTPDQANQLNNSTVEDYSAPEGKLLEGIIGYVAVFAFGAQSEDEVNEYADKIQTIIIDLDKQSVCGWIVDLREDQGGNMYPMIAGLGMLIGEGELGSFKDATGEISHWYYRDVSQESKIRPLQK